MRAFIRLPYELPMREPCSEQPQCAQINPNKAQRRLMQQSTEHTEGRNAVSYAIYKMMVSEPGGYVIYISEGDEGAT